MALHFEGEKPDDNRSLPFSWSWAATTVALAALWYDPPGFAHDMGWIFATLAVFSGIITIFRVQVEAL